MHPSTFSPHVDSHQSSEPDIKNYYTCPMHPEIKEDSPGECPKCGGMKLVKKSELDSGHAEHDHASMMATPEAAADFLRRFFIVTALLVPLTLFSAPAVTFLGLPDFTLRPFLELGIATIIFYFGLVFFEHASHEIKLKQYGMMTLVSLGVGAGYLFSAVATFMPGLEVEFYLEISTLIWVLLFGHFLEAKSSTAAGDALQEVAKLLPKKAHLKGKDGFSDVKLESLQKGDVVLVKPGEKVPADGEIVRGASEFNESHLTGESKPIEKEKGSQVPAGAISIAGSVEVKLTRVGESSTIGQIQDLISQAKKTKPSAQKLADRAAKWLTFSALSVSILALIIWSIVVGQSLVFATTIAITVLVIACPHALGLAIPTVSTIATRLAIKNGVFIKDMAKIEMIKDIDYVIFDKTGTLTKGEFGVTDVEPLTCQRDDLLRVVGGIEHHSSHVIGLAIASYLREHQLEPFAATEIKNIAGKGMSGKISGSRYWVGNKRLMEDKKVWAKVWTNEGATILEKFSTAGKTPVFVADDKNILGVIGLSDQIKPASIDAVKELHQLGIKVAMITGDTQATAKFVADELGIDAVFAEVLPEDKYKHVQKLQAQNQIVLMAGDGVNDAPALTQANVGVAIGAGTEVAVEAGDVVLTESNPQHLVRLIVLSKKVYAKMVQNLWWALGYNIIAIPAAAGLFVPFGFRLSPAVGALLMSLSSVIVVINAMMLRRESV